MAAARESYGWVGHLEITVNPGRQHTEEEKAILSADPEVRLGNNADGNQKLGNWVQATANLTAKEAASRAGNYPREGTDRITADVTIQFTDNPLAVADTKTVPITSVRYRGIVERRIETISSVTKALFKLGDSNPIAGCVISDFGDFGLVALIVTNQRNVQLARVTISERNKRKIKELKMTRA